MASAQQPGAPAAAAGGSGRKLVLWFRNDLRLHDNAIVATAMHKVKANEVDSVLPVYCFDPRFFAKSAWGTPKTGPHRAQFLLESVLDLKASLRRVGSDLVVAVGKPEEVIPQLLAASGGGGQQQAVAAAPARGGGAVTVVAQAEVTSEEAAVESALTSALRPLGGKLQTQWNMTLYHLDDLPFKTSDGLRDMPDVFTPFKDKVESRCKVRPEGAMPAAGQLGRLPPSLPAGAVDKTPSWQELPYPKDAHPAAPTPHPQAVLQFKGGETAALARLKYYLWDSDLLATYFDTRNGMLGGDYSTKFAPWLAHGCLSPRTIYHAIKAYEAKKVSNKSTYWVVFELIWRDFFRFFALKHGNAIFYEGGTSGLPLVWAKDPELFERWKAGRTGQPLVDANMRELAATGFMSNRGRQNVASYLVLDLGVDWRRGGDWFEHTLLDYDVASNWGNWVSAAGLTGGRINHFNITKQSKDYDEKGDYIRAWLPELKNVPAARIHEPWLMSKEEQDRYGVRIGQDYPNPIPASRYGRPHGGGGGGGRGGGRGGGYDGGRGRPMSGRGGGGGRMGGQYKKSAFERYG